MKRAAVALPCAFVAAWASLAGPPPPTSPPQVRPPSAAGLFYPSDPDDLRGAIRKLLGAVPRAPIPGRIRALLVPHAALEVSGPLAAYAFAQLDRDYHRVFVISVNHDRERYFRGAWIPPFDAYRTPLGEVPVDAIARRLAGSPPFRDISGVSDEYVIENPLPFLQQTLGQFTLVPVVLGEVSEGALRSLAVDLAALADERTLFVFSLDLSNAYRRARARQVDEGTLRRLLSLDPRLKLGATEGNDVLRLAVFLSRQLGLRADLLGYWNSADLGLPRHWAVGYASVLFYEEDARALELVPREWETLMLFAARQFAEELRGRPEPEPRPAAARSGDTVEGSGDGDPSLASALRALDPGSALREWRGCALRLLAGGRILEEEVELYPSASLLETVDGLAHRLGRRCRAYRCLDGAGGPPEFRLAIAQAPRRLGATPAGEGPRDPASLLRPAWSPERLGLLLVRGLRDSVYLGGEASPEAAFARLCGGVGLEAGCAASPRSRLYPFGLVWSAPQSLRTNS